MTLGSAYERERMMGENSRRPGQAQTEAAARALFSPSWPSSEVTWDHETEFETMRRENAGSTSWPKLSRWGCSPCPCFFLSASKIDNNNHRYRIYMVSIMMKIVFQVTGLGQLSQLSCNKSQSPPPSLASPMQPGWRAAHRPPPHPLFPGVCLECPLLCTTQMLPILHSPDQTLPVKTFLTLFNGR